MATGARSALDHGAAAAWDESGLERAAYRYWPRPALADGKPLDSSDLGSEILRLGELIVHYSPIRTQLWERDASLVRVGGADPLFVAITPEGAGRATLHDRAFARDAGYLRFHDLSQIPSDDGAAHCTMLVIVPRAVATARGLDVAELHGIVLRSGAAAMLAPHLLGARAAARELGVADRALLGRTVLDLLVLAVAASRDEAEAPAVGRGAAAAVLARAAIEEGLGSPSLTIANLCRRLGLSRTSLHRLFRADGGVQAYIRGRRLEAVRRALLDPTRDDPLYVLAERLGFSDAPHLSRLFRARYGLTPSAWRARARAERER